MGKEPKRITITRLYKPDDTAMLRALQIILEIPRLPPNSVTCRDEVDAIPAKIEPLQTN